MNTCICMAESLSCSPEIITALLIGYVLSRSVMSDSLGPHSLQSTRLLWPWGFSRQEYWSGLPCLPPGDLPDPGIEIMSLIFPALEGGFFTTSATWETQFGLQFISFKRYFNIVAYQNSLSALKTIFHSHSGYLSETNKNMRFSCPWLVLHCLRIQIFSGYIYISGSFTKQTSPKLPIMKIRDLTRSATVTFLFPYRVT